MEEGGYGSKEGGRSSGEGSQGAGADGKSTTKGGLAEGRSAEGDDTAEGNSTAGDSAVRDTAEGIPKEGSPTSRDGVKASRVGDQSWRSRSEANTRINRETETAPTEVRQRQGGRVRCIDRCATSQATLACAANPGYLSKVDSSRSSCLSHLQPIPLSNSAAFSFTSDVAVDSALLRLSLYSSGRQERSETDERNEKTPQEARSKGRILLPR